MPVQQTSNKTEWRRITRRTDTTDPRLTEKIMCQWRERQGIQRERDEEREGERAGGEVERRKVGEQKRGINGERERRVGTKRIRFYINICITLTISFGLNFFSVVRLKNYLFSSCLPFHRCHFGLCTLGDRVECHILNDARDLI